MFELRGTRLRLTQGDTGLLTIRSHSEHKFTAQDRVVFTMRRPSGAVMTEMVLTPQEDGTVRIPFTNAMTDRWKPGKYTWDVRYALDAVIEDGRVTDGREVITPMAPSEIEVIKGVGEI